MENGLFDLDKTLNFLAKNNWEAVPNTFSTIYKSILKCGCPVPSLIIRIAFNVVF